ncbi:hypothetical protein bcere0002_48550 [Bacillus cereus ATCC 10876]|nr:hypothetical protein bcere0002_48550 [Bacillus cereus ATCC 10876]
MRCVGRIGAAMCSGVLMRRHVQGYSYAGVIVGKTNIVFFSFEY